MPQPFRFPLLTSRRTRALLWLGASLGTVLERLSSLLPPSARPNPKPDAPALLLWAERRRESLPYGCIALRVPLLGGTATARTTLREVVAGSFAPMATHHPIDVTVAGDELVLRMRSATAQEVPVRPFVAEAAGRSGMRLLVGPEQDATDRPTLLRRH